MLYLANGKQYMVIDSCAPNVGVSSREKKDSTSPLYTSVHSSSQTQKSNSSRDSVAQRSLPHVRAEVSVGSTHHLSHYSSQERFTPTSGTHCLTLWRREFSVSLLSITTSLHLQRHFSAHRTNTTRLLFVLTSFQSRLSLQYKLNAFSFGGTPRISNTVLMDRE